MCYFKTILSTVLLNCPQAEIEKYKAEREKAFAEYEAKFSGAKDDIAARIESDTRNKISGMNQSVGSNKPAVISFLIDSVVKIEPKVHRNYRTSA